MKKYKLVYPAEEYCGRTVYRIEALIDFDTNARSVKKGDVGGWVSSEDNLSQLGTCWIFDDGMVVEDAVLEDCATAQKQAQISGKSVVRDSAYITDEVIVDGEVEIYGEASLYEKCRVVGKSKVFQRSTIAGRALVTGSPTIYGDSVIHESAFITGNPMIKDTEVVGYEFDIGTDENEDNENVLVEKKETKKTKKQSNNEDIRIIDGKKFRKKIIWEEI